MPKSVIVIGGGVIGVTTAAALAMRGAQVTLLERSQMLGSGATARNGGQLSYSYVDALAGPALRRQLPALLGGCDPAFRIHPSLDRTFVTWTARFLANCTASRFAANTRAVLRLALRSRAALTALRARHPQMDFRHSASGKLHLYDAREKFAAAQAVMDVKNELGCGQRALAIDDVLAIEPTLWACGRNIVGAIYSPLDEAGDPQLFTQALASIAASRYGLTVLTETPADRLIADRRGVRSVQTCQGVIEADAFVLALGCGSFALARQAGVRLPIYPMKGYSITLPATSRSPAVSITDARARIVFCRLHDQMRIAGMAELGAANDRIDAARVASLLHAGRTCLPAAADWSAHPHPWSGQRPMTPDSRPIVSATPVGNLFVNSGHGMLGWTLACASAELMTALVLEQCRASEDRIMAEDFSLARFT